MRFGVWEILLIIVLVLVLFGGSKLAGVGKNLGRGIKEFKEEIKDTDDGSAQKAETVTEDAEAAQKVTAEKDSEPKA